jgi:hypothetical protein
MERSSYGSRVQLLWRRSTALAADSAGFVGAVADVTIRKATLGSVKVAATRLQLIQPKQAFSPFFVKRAILFL